MRIGNSGAEFIRTDPAREIQRSTAEGVARNATQPASAANRGDKVAISDEARKLARGADAAGGANSALAPEQIAQYREKILSGAYNSLEVVEQVARKMLTSGDI
jgi:negative regulator of flagellin synthesis FlgM